MDCRRWAAGGSFMWEYMERRALACARYILDTGCTVRACAAHFGVSKSTVHKDVTERLKGGGPRRMAGGAPRPQQKSRRASPARGRRHPSQVSPRCRKERAAVSGKRGAADTPRAGRKAGHIAKFLHKNGQTEGVLPFFLGRSGRRERKIGARFLVIFRRL